MLFTKKEYGIYARKQIAYYYTLFFESHSEGETTGR